MMNRSGQALLEAIGLLSLLQVSVIGGLIVCYIGFAQMWMDYLSYEAVLCLAQNQNRTSCENTVNDKLNTFLKFGKLDEFLLKDTLGTLQCKIVWKLKRDQEWKIKSHFSLNQNQINRASQWYRL